MLRIERDATTIVWTIDRPKTKNALDGATLDALERACEDADADATARAVVLTGAGGDFVSGGDLRQLRGATTIEEATSFSEAGARVCGRLAALRIPVIAAVAGVAFGGGAELLTACDLRLADETARVSFKQARMGVTTAWGTMRRLVACVGHGAAARLLYTAEELSARDALAIGLVDRVVEAGRARDAALAWAADVAAAAPRAIADLKALLRVAREDPANVDREERARFVATWTSDDHREAVEAYFERRAPRWTGR